jgi:hypothetical protein
MLTWGRVDSQALSQSKSYTRPRLDDMFPANLTTVVPAYVLPASCQVWTIQEPLHFTRIQPLGSGSLAMPAMGICPLTCIFSCIIFHQ